MLLVPYVSTTAFRAHPTFLDLLNLRSGDSSLADQTAELNNILLMASAWADNFVEVGLPNGSLAARTVTENKRMRLDRCGRLSFHPSHTPVISVSQVSYGPSITDQTVLTAPTVWVDSGWQVLVEVDSSGTSTRLGGLSRVTDLLTSWVYVAGYVNTVLAGNVSAGATSISVVDPTGIVAGSVLRLWDPGVEEAATVASTYTVGSTTVPLTAALASAHTTTNPVGVSSLPPDAHLAVVLYATALLLRPDTSKEDAFPDARIGPSSREADAREDGSGLVLEAERILQPYRRVI